VSHAALAGEHCECSPPSVLRVSSSYPQPLPAMQSIDVWNQIRMRLPTVQDDDEDAPSHTVQAIPPSNEIPDGINHCVLIHVGENAGRTQIKGTHIKRVNMY
jgi:hypothetical protein